MLPRTRLASPLLVASLGLAPHLAGCLDTTIVGGEGGGGGDDAGSPSGVVTTGSPTGGAGGASAATAWLGTELQGADRVDACALNPCEGNDTLFLVVDALGSSCSDAFTSTIWDDTFTENTWTMAIGVPPSHQDVGVHVLDEDFYTQTGESIAGESGPSGVVGGGGLGGLSGTLEILELGASTVRFVVRDTGKPVDGIEYAASRCGVATLPPEGIALAGDAIAGDPAVDGGGLTFVVGSELPLCTDALPSTCEGDTWQVAVSLPGDYVTPGTYALTDPRITVTHCAALPKFLGGTLEVLDLVGDELVVRFADVVDHELELEQELRLARCP